MTDHHNSTSDEIPDGTAAQPEAEQVETVAPEPGELDAARIMLAADPASWTGPVGADGERRRTRDLIALLIVMAVVVIPVFALTSLREPTADTTDLDAPALLNSYSAWLRTGRGLTGGDAADIWESTTRHDLGGGRTIAGLVDSDGTCWSIVIGPGSATAATTEDPDACGSDTDSTTSRQGASR